jgi:toxin FitB
MILLDTNVVSELWKLSPSAATRQWFEQQPRTSLYLSAIVLGEIQFGVQRLPEGKRRSWFADAIAKLERTTFRDRILSFDQKCAPFYGRVKVIRERAGRPVLAADAAIAATALTYGLALATRNIKDFEGLDLELINPFEPQS